MLRAYQKMLRRVLQGCSCLRSTLRCVCGQRVTGLTGRNTRCPECSHIPSTAQFRPHSGPNVSLCPTHAPGVVIALWPAMFSGSMHGQAPTRFQHFS